MEKIQHYDKLFKLVKNQRREEFRKNFLRLHKRDQADFFQELYPDNKAKIADLLDPVEFAELFQYMDKASKWESIETLPKNYLSESFDRVPDDVLTDFILDLEEDKKERVLSQMKEETRRLVESLLSSKFETAGAAMTTKFIGVSVEDTADQVIQQMRNLGRKSEMIYYLYCVDKEERLQGVVSLRDLILSSGDSLIQDIMNHHPVYVHVDTDQEEAARYIRDYDLLAIPVVDSQEVLVGIVTVDDVIDILEEETTEDFHKFSGILAEEEENQVDSVRSMTRKRLPWIIILIFLGLISANLIDFFEETLSQIVALAAFMPMILDSAGNVGTQALAVAVRRITLGEKEKEGFLNILGKEFLTGIVIGIVAGMVIGILSYIMYGNIILGLIVGISLTLTLSISTVIGYVVPSLFHRLGIDPAVASGPFITTICDTIALLIYFGLATYFIHLF